MSQAYFIAPDDPHDTEGRRDILEILRATDAANDNEPAVRQAHTDSPRLRGWQEQFKALLIWRRLRDDSEAGACGSTWMAEPGDPAAPTQAEAGKLNDWSPEYLIEKASQGVIWKEVGGRIVPHKGQVEYDAFGRTIRCGALIIAGATGEPIAANDDDKPQPTDDDDKVEVIGGVKRPTERVEEVDDPDDISDDIADIFGRALGSGEDIDRGRRHGDKVRVGEIIGILHRTAKSDKFVVLKEPRNAAGRFRTRKGKLPPPSYTVSPDDRIDSQEMLDRILPLVSADTVMVLDYALRAANLSDIGEIFGKSGKNAERVGKQKLIDACAEFDAALQTAKEEGARRLAA
ncbi:hypothetical protein [Bosea minatitlanensis]|uniref:Sigma-70 family RNA polymerase sigma factor n=1 Tax=Bosea minatitlanensis TaxID=128782 RepID=A0ABW0EWY7_9HYPH|nr:hypothetical protein [Bosea minatitlanensis]MCT4495442.1 hypothetical protein [Bosea minatitlanensis]